MDKQMIKRKRLPEDQLRERGWKILVEELGLADATRFILLFRQGNGDSVLEFQQMWDGKTIEEIHTEILEAVRQGEV